MKKLNIIVGHSAYSGRNKQQYHSTKTSAVADLMNRGFTRAVARRAVNEVLSRPCGHKVLTHMPSHSLVEVFNSPYQFRN